MFKTEVIEKDSILSLLFPKQRHVQKGGVRFVPARDDFCAKKCFCKKNDS